MKTYLTLPYLTIVSSSLFFWVLGYVEYSGCDKPTESKW